MTRVKFVKLEREEKLQEICRLTEDCFQAEKGLRLLLLVEDENQAVALDRFLWTWDKGAFLPHAFDNGSVECVNEPIVISTREANGNGATILIMGIPCSHEFIKEFELVIDFAEVYDSQLADAARERFRQYRRLGFNPQMY